MKTLTHTFQISDDAWKLLLSIQKEGYAEYRDNYYNTLEEYLQDHPGDLEYQTKRFFSRNHGGTYYLVSELLKYNLIEDVENSWHITYKVTKLAEDLIMIELRDEKIESVIKI